MRRRDLLKWTTLGAGAVGLPWLLTGPSGARPREAPTAPPTAKELAVEKKLPALKITNVKTILTAPAKIRLVVVKVETNEPGLYGLGCATFTQRARVVETAVDKYLKPFLLGKDPLNIEDIWQSCFVSVVLAQRSGARQRHQRHRHGAVGHPRQAGRDAGLSAARRQVSQRRRDLSPRQRGNTFRKWRRPSGGDGQGLAARSRPGRHSRPGDLRRTATSPIRTDARQRAHRSLGARPLRPRRAEAVRASAQAGRRRGGAAARHARARAADPGDANWRRIWSNFGCSSWKIRSARRTSATSPRCVSRPRRRSRWASCSTTRTSGCRSSRIG